ARTVTARTYSLSLPAALPILPHLQSGKLRALGVSSGQRSSLLPEVPTIAEAGVPGFDDSIWFGLWTRAAPAPAVLDKLANDVARSEEHTSELQSREKARMPPP